MPRIVFVPGKNPKPPPDVHRAQLWRCLLEGVRRADSRAADRMSEHAKAFQLADWNHDYYGEYRDITEDLPWIDLLLHRHGPSEEDLQRARNWQLRLTGLAYRLADLVPAVIPLIPSRGIRSTIVETCRYFNRCDNRGESGDVPEGIGDRVRNILKHLLLQDFASREPVLLIGHSLGSVIAYDALWSLTHEDAAAGKVDLFLTLGSPLGMNFVKRRLRGSSAQSAARYPHNIRRWVNVAAVGDLTALDASLRNDFREMLDLGLIEDIRDMTRRIHNYYRDVDGLNVHRSYGYLVNPAVGVIIADWWREQELQGNRVRTEVHASPLE